MSPVKDSALPTASWPRRFLALFVDWIVSLLVAAIFVPGHHILADSQGHSSWQSQLYPLLVFIVESGLFTWLLGGSFGKLVTGLRVLPADGVPRPISPIVLLVRQFLITLVIPPLVFRPDGRGLHDLMAGTTTVTADTFHSVFRRPTGRPNR